MADKNVILQHFWNGITLAGTTTVGPWVFNTLQIDDIMLDFGWTGTVTGAFKFEISASFRANSGDQTQFTTPGANMGAPLNVGNWYDITSTAVTPTGGAITQPDGSFQALAVCFSSVSVFAASPFLRVTFVQATGSGVVDGYSGGKGLG